MSNRFVIRTAALCLLVALSMQATADTVSIEPNTDRMGGDYKGFPLQVDDPQLCRLACEQDNVCKAYTFVRAIRQEQPRAHLELRAGQHQRLSPV